MKIEELIKAIEASALVGPICDEIVEALKRYTDGEKTEGLIGETLRDELIWVDKIYEEDPMDCWINGYRNALNTALRRVNTHHSEKATEEEYKTKIKRR